MRIGITGGTGFIGSALGQEAVKRGHEVVVFSRRKEVSLPWAKEVRGVPGEAGGKYDLEGLDAIVHLSGESVMGRWTAEKKKRIVESRVESTRGIVDSIKESKDGPKVFLCASGSGYYGDRGEEILRESSSHGKGFLAEVCVQWEEAGAAATPLGVRVAHLRTGMVLGRNGGAWPLLKKVFTFFLGSRLASGKQWVPWIHLEDEVGIILHALENDACRGPLNLSSPNPVTNAEMTSIMAEVLHRPVMPPVPAFALKLVLGEMGSVALESQRALPAAPQATGYQFKHSDLKEALQSLL